jgi:hypothetical protein
MKDSARLVRVVVEQSDARVLYPFGGHGRDHDHIMRIQCVHRGLFLFAE